MRFEGHFGVLRAMSAFIIGHCRKAAEKGTTEAPDQSSGTGNSGRRGKDRRGTIELAIAYIVTILIYALNRASKNRR